MGRWDDEFRRHQREQQRYQRARKAGRDRRGEVEELGGSGRWSFVKPVQPDDYDKDED